MIKTAIEKVTPEIATKLLAGLVPANQRRLSPHLVTKYANAMSHGQWVINHQGIAVTEDGDIPDGQHRLHAIIESGCTVEIMVTRGLPEKQGKVFTFDTIDRGCLRGIGSQLQVRHGIGNGNRIAASCACIAYICSRNFSGMSVENTLDIYGMYKNNFNTVMPLLGSTQKFRSASIIGTLAFCHHVNPGEIETFTERVGLGEHIGSGDPSFALRNYLLNFPGSYFRKVENTIALAAMHHVLGNKLKQIKASSIGIDYFRDRQPKMVNRVRDIMGIKSA